LQDTYKRTTEAVLGHLFGTIGMKMPKTNRTEEVPNMDLSSGFFL
jgi:hypothetical protein